MLYRVINPKVSLLVSLFSGAGFIVLLAFAPLKKERSTDSLGVLIKPEKTRKIFEETNTNFGNKSSDNNAFSEKRSGEANFFNAVPVSNLNIEKSENELSITHGKAISNSIFPFSQQQIYVPVNGESSVYYKDDNVLIQSILGSKTPFTEGEKRNIASHYPVYENLSSIRMMELSYAITPVVSAVVKTSNSEFAGDKTKEQTTALAGISLNGGKFFSTGIVAGDTTVSGLNNYAYQSQVPVVIPASRNMASMTDYGQNPQGKLLEWQANLVPSQYLKVQTALYNSRKDNSTDPALDGGRVSVLLNLKNLALNLRYNYMNAEAQKERNQFYRTSNPGGSDFAAVGLTVFLDKNKNYSFYVGGNYANIATSTANGGVTPPNIQNPLLFPYSFNLNQGGLSQMNTPNASSFSASFRGKPKASSNATFFVNFRNQYSKDTIYSSLGPFQIPILSQATFDYATALGLELSF